jgi:hypothetical protein
MSREGILIQHKKIDDHFSVGSVQEHLYWNRNIWAKKWMMGFVNQGK